MQFPSDFVKLGPEILKFIFGRKNGRLFVLFYLSDFGFLFLN